nr:hypothetical protein [Tanacetum cinerariifolium]
MHILKDPSFFLTNNIESPQTEELGLLVLAVGSTTLAFSTGLVYKANVLQVQQQIDLSYFGLEEFQQPEFENYRPKSCKTESKNASKSIPNELKESPDAPLVKDRASNNKDCLV